MTKSDDKEGVFFLTDPSPILKASFGAATSVAKLLAWESVVGRPFLVGMQDGPRRTLPKATILAGGGADKRGAG